MCMIIDGMSNQIALYKLPFSVSDGVIFRCMLSVRQIQRQVFRRVVRFIVIDMMNNFVGLKKSAKLLFHNKSVLKNISKRDGIGMIWPVNIYIASAMKFSPTPLRVFFSNFSMARLNETFPGTINLVIVVYVLFLLFAYWANFHYHNCFSWFTIVNQILDVYND